MKKVLSLLLALTALTSAFVFPVSAEAASINAPYGITSVKVGSKAVKVCWVHVQEAKNYKVYRATSKKGKYKLIKTTKAYNVTDKKLSPSKTYYYKVVALNGKKKSKASKIISVKLKSMKSYASNGAYSVIFTASDLSFDKKNNEYVLKAKACDPIVFSKARVKKMKKGSTFTVTYLSKKNTKFTQKFKVTYNDGSDVDLKLIKSTETNTKTKKSKSNLKKSKEFYYRLMSTNYADGIANGNFVLLRDAGKVLNYASSRTVYIRAKKNSKLYLTWEPEEKSETDFVFDREFFKDNYSQALGFCQYEFIVKNNYAKGYNNEFMVG